MPAPIRHLAEVDSTNLRAMAWVRTGAPHGAVLTADYQSAGRGRHQRAWISARGQNVMLSMILRTAFGNRVGWVPLAAGLAVAETVDAITNEAGTPVQAQVKWPNDVRIGTGKLAGILAESAGDAIVLGIGLNVNQTLFPDDVPATSLTLETGVTFDRNNVLHALIHRLRTQLDALPDQSFEAFNQAYRVRLANLGERVTLHTGAGTAIEGQLLGIAPSGGLLLDVDGTPKTFYAGDVSGSLRSRSEWTGGG